jgi:hypothetical protein
VQLRVAPEALSRRVIAALFALCCCLGACQASARDVGITWTIEPARPAVQSVATIRFTLENPRGEALRGARLRLAAHMSHPGMTPLAARVTDRGDGTYESRLELSMSGNWTLVVSGELADGRRITRQTEVAVVEPTP